MENQQRNRGQKGGDHPEGKLRHPGSSVQGVGFRVKAVGFRMLGFRVSGLGGDQHKCADLRFSGLSFPLPRGFDALAAET